MSKGQYPDTLVLTATPILRSLSLTLYGDLALSLLDEKPPGRRPVKTIVKSEENRQEIYTLLHRQLWRGRQAYVVYPLIEESEKLHLKGATEMAKLLQNKVFPDHVVGLLHGQMGSVEKKALMCRFQEGDIQVLVCTTVIEVGINIPNASVMLVEHAERFGLSQLHQLRGRIGRVAHPGLCLLMTGGLTSTEAYQRLDILSKTSDGFEIAEKDLEIRGPGEFVGTRQSGIPQFHFGNLVRDRHLLELAQQEAVNFLSEKGTPNEEQMTLLMTGPWKEHFQLYGIG